MTPFADEAGRLLDRLREKKPLIHHITNFVVMTDTANATLHVGALPVMAHARDEVAEMVAAADALVLNYGTLSPSWVDAMLLAGRRANERGIPVVLDPVGAGATTLRTETGLRLLRELDVTIVRGNAGEVAALMGADGTVRGVESIDTGRDAAELAREAADAWNAAVAITGRRDVVADGDRLLTVDNGHKWLQTRTGTGCAATAVVAAFAAVAQDYGMAAAAALATYGLAAERAAPEATGPASFAVVFFDLLYNLSPEDVRRGARITEGAPA